MAKASPKKKVVAKKKVAPKKKVVAKKKVAPKKKAVAKKKVAPKKKIVAKKKVAPKKKVVAKKKVAPKKKVVAKKKVAPKKKVVAKKKVAPKKKVVAKKRVAPKKKVVAKKKVSPKKNAVKKVTTKKTSAPVSKTAKSKSKKIKKTKYTAKELAYFKEIILKERNQIIESAKANRRSLVDDESGEYVGDNQTYASHMAEQGSDEMEREKNYMFVQRDEKYLGYLNEALLRIDFGTYGICIDCSEDPKMLCKSCPLIQKERLELVPITQHCIECKNIRG